MKRENSRNYNIVKFSGVKNYFIVYKQLRKKGMEFAFSRIMIMLILLATLIVILIFYGGLRDKILMLFGEIF